MDVNDKKQKQEDEEEGSSNSRYLAFLTHSKGFAWHPLNLRQTDQLRTHAYGKKVTQWTNPKGKNTSKQDDCNQDWAQFTRKN